MELFLLDYVAFFVIIALGLIIGDFKIKGISLDSSAIIFVALLFGHFGVKIPEIIQKIGLIFFIYSVGIQAGPGFFESFKKDGLRLLAFTMIVVVSGAVITVGLALMFKIDFKMAVGLFSGALTSTPGLAAAIESTKSTMASIGYGIAYPFGVLGVILFVKLAPKLFRVSIPLEEEKYDKNLSADFPSIVNKNFKVENPNIFDKTLGDLKIRTMTSTNISRVMHNGEAFTPNAKTILHQGDLIKAVGTEKDLQKIHILIGPETDQDIPLSTKYLIHTFLVTNQQVVNKSLAQIGLFEQYDATMTAIRRAGIDITPNSATKLHFGDKVRIALNEQNLENVKKLLGDNRKKLVELDFLPVSLGIIIGVLIGTIDIPIFGLKFSLGLTGGVLISAILLSRIGKTGNILWNVSGSSNQLLRKIGLVFFLVSVGTNAGEHLLETLQTGGLTFFLAGVVITMVPMIVSVVIGYYIMGFNFLVLLGALTGSMTSTPALSAIDPMTESNAPKLAYASVYPFALVLIIICSQIMSKL